jgi:hypothetical protein
MVLKMKIFRLIRNSAIIMAIFAILLLVLLRAYELSDVDVSPNNATTSDNLICTWNLTGSGQVNISWYNGTELYQTIIDATNPQTLSSSLTSRGSDY